jgi:hypothetical protein
VAAVTQRASVLYREAKPDDRTFIVKSWCSSFRAAHAAGIWSISPLHTPCANCGAPQPLHYDAVAPHHLSAILDRPGCKAWVAYNPRAEPPFDLHAYVVVERDAPVPKYRAPHFEMVIESSPDPLVHMVFVKQAYRRFGLARGLFAVAGVDPAARFLYSTKTSIVATLEQARKIPNAKWSPLSARFEKKAKSPP